MARPESTPLGFACPCCRHPMPAECGRRAGPGLVVRARLCPRCGHARLTRERAVRGDRLLADRPGFVCRAHLRPLHCECIRRAGPGIVIRYLRCPDCGPAVPLVRTEERDGCSTPVAGTTAVRQDG